MVIAIFFCFYEILLIDALGQIRPRGTVFEISNEWNIYYWYWLSLLTGELVVVQIGQIGQTGVIAPDYVERASKYEHENVLVKTNAVVD